MISAVEGFSSFGQFWLLSEYDDITVLQGKFFVFANSLPAVCTIFELWEGISRAV